MATEKEARYGIYKYLGTKGLENRSDANLMINQFLKVCNISIARPEKFTIIQENFNRFTNFVHNNIETLKDFGEIEMSNMQQLAQAVQLDFHKSLTSSVVGVSGPDHVPVIEVEIVLPDGEEFIGVGKNQREAKEALAGVILKKYYPHLLEVGNE